MNELNLNELFATFAGFVAGIPIITQFLKNLFNTNGSITQGISWGIGLVLAIVGWFLNLGIFETLEWWQALLIGMSAALSANGVADAIKSKAETLGDDKNKLED